MNKGFTITDPIALGLRKGDTVIVKRTGDMAKVQYAYRDKNGDVKIKTEYRGGKVFTPEEVMLRIYSDQPDFRTCYPVSLKGKEVIAMQTDSKHKTKEIERGRKNPGEIIL